MVIGFLISTLGSSTSHTHTHTHYILNLKILFIDGFCRYQLSHGVVLLVMPGEK